LSVRTITIRTAADGSFTYERSFRGTIRALELQLGDLSTPDIDVTDDTYSKSFLSVNGVAADTVYFPSEFLEAADGTSAALVGTAMKGATAAVCMGVLKVAVTGGGDTKRGRLVVLYD
jgi:hypothetical protein